MLRFQGQGCTTDHPRHLPWSGSAVQWISRSVRSCCFAPCRPQEDSSVGSLRHCQNLYRIIPCITCLFFRSHGFSRFWRCFSMTNCRKYRKMWVTSKSRNHFQKSSTPYWWSSLEMSRVSFLQVNLLALRCATRWHSVSGHCQTLPGWGSSWAPQKSHRISLIIGTSAAGDCCDNR